MLFSFNDKKEVLNTSKAKGYQLADTSLNEIVFLHLHSQGEIPSHSLPINVVFHVISGKGEICIDHKIFHAQKGDVIEVLANQQRSWQNKNNKLLELLVIKNKLFGL